MKKAILSPEWVMQATGYLILNLEKLVFIYYNKSKNYMLKGVFMKNLFRNVNRGGAFSADLRQEGCKSSLIQ